MSRPELERLLSTRTGHIFNAAIAQGLTNEENLILALQTIKIACMFNRITEEEKEKLQNQIVKREPFDILILSKLTKGERVVLDEIQPSSNSVETSNETIEEIQCEVESIKNELSTLYKQQNDENSNLCFICNEDVGANGLACNMKHYQCNNCFTLWLSVLNNQRTENFDLLQARNGMVRCTFENCESSSFSRAQVCTHANDENVLECFLDNLQYIENLKSFAEYQEKLLELTREMSAAEKEESESNSRSSSSSSSSSNDLKTSSGKSDLSDLSAADRMKKRVELESLAQSLKLQMPDARMCGHCSYGPMIHRACDDLRAHHGETSHDNAKAAINNSCPGCGKLCY